MNFGLRISDCGFLLALFWNADGWAGGKSEIRISKSEIKLWR
jgi:hypothetical protein